MQRPQKRVRLPKATDRLPLGSSGLSVSPICLGMTTAATVRAAFAAGVNFFFISNDLHWPLYMQLMLGISELLASGVQRDEIVIAGVSYLSEPLFQYLQFNELLAAVPRVARIDILIAGAAEDGNFLPRYKSLDRARGDKKWGCAAIGASFHDRATAKMAICSDLLDLAYVRYNPAHAGCETELFPHLGPGRSCLTYNFKSTMAYVPEPEFRRLNLGAEYPHPTITDGYRFALSRPELDGLLVSPQTPEQLAELLQALDRGPLPASKMKYMKDLYLLASGQATLDSE
ncbi:MAG TPA: hypothetical protein PLW65_21920 [Pseudomonadota bacterium]|nr:hypothetical protein [Pseudomonadota bacterium]